jgi:hypothetical protein
LTRGALPLNEVAEPVELLAAAEPCHGRFPGLPAVLRHAGEVP